jgi:histidinol-phosphate aminotransferase
VIQAISPRTRAIAVVSPNNPTGAIATADDLKALSAAAPNALLIVDLAYVEFAAEDLTPAVLELPNAIAVRTFSKAWGLAGLRVGYALGPADIIAWLRTVGGPYPTSGIALWLAAQRLKAGRPEVRKFVQRVCTQRDQLQSLLLSYGAEVLPSQANFVLARFGNAACVRAGLAERGIAVRGFSSRPQLADALRITSPGDEAAFSQLTTALNELRIADPDAFRTTCTEETDQ